MSWRKIDGHVHLVGDGSAGSGCWLEIEGNWKKLLGKVILKTIGLSPGVLQEGLDEPYLERLLEQIRSSSLDALLLLAQEVPHDERGRKIKGAGTFHVPNDHVLKLSKNHPELIPAVSIHPARVDAMEELEKCLEGGSRVMKCLPNCQNINCNDRHFETFWGKMAESGMLLLAHTGGEMTLPVVDPRYADPETLRLPLECGVTVIAAHCGGRSCLCDPDYTESLLNMFEEFPNLYGDNSALCSPIRSQTLKKILKPGIMGRIIHGSDYPIPVSGFGPWLRGCLDWKDYRRWEKEPNILERDYQLKRCLGFAEETFTRLDQLISGVKTE